MQKAVHQQDILEKLDKKQGALQDKFQQDPELLDYYWNTWLDKRAEKFYRYYINELLNFGITISSSLEGAYARLKDRLPLSIGDLGGIIKQTNGFIRYQVEEYEFDIAESINRILFNYQIPLFRQLNIKVIRPAREEILKQYQIVKELPEGQDLGLYKGQFRRLIGLPYKHEIQRLLL